MKAIAVDGGAHVKGGRAARAANAPGENRRWTFLTNHGSVLAHIAGHPDDTLREISDQIRLTERTTASIVADLRQDGYVKVTRRGRHNHYRVNSSKRLRRPVHSKTRVGALIDILGVLTEDKERPLTPASKD
ncbi:MAG: ArsR family transcriptional regulator [Chloroflexi bacterium]|nr:MAG: ArsR family transcriptional regulator [Chloroflexota bacterium]